MMMEKFAFRITVETNDQTGDVMAVYFRVRKGKSVKVHEFADGNAFADYNRKGELIGIEMLGPCKISVLDKIAIQPPVKKFIRNAIPKAMAMA